jgi:hypothetical protein
MQKMMTVGVACLSIAVLSWSATADTAARGKPKTLVINAEVPYGTEKDLGKLGEFLFTGDLASPVNLWHGTR